MLSVLLFRLLILANECVVCVSLLAGVTAVILGFWFSFVLVGLYCCITLLLVINSYVCCCCG